jgi:hypothetical protein
MRTNSTHSRTIHNSGQTLIMALLVLGVLMILGFVFLGVINRNILAAGRTQQRNVATDLAEAGVRYAHAQLLNSELGADWRGTPAELAPEGGNTTRDPDVLYLRPGTGFGVRSDQDPQPDLGGPDGLGPYVRVNFQNGRALVRVRFAPSDANLFSTTPGGAMRQPGRARSYTIIEAVGRPGRLNLNDPTTLPDGQAIQFSGYANATAFRQTLGEMRNRDRVFVQSRKLMAFASIGIIESGHFIANKFNVTRPAEVGFPTGVGAVFEGEPVQVPVIRGISTSGYNMGGNPALSATPIELGGSLFSNADLLVHGVVNAKLNTSLGDQWAINGTIMGADQNSALVIDRIAWGGAAWQTQTATLTGQSLNSRSPGFTTFQGVLRDGVSRQDRDGYPRGIGRKDPPSIERTDPDTGVNRYVALTRNSGAITATGNTGRFGHGRNIYVNNSSDRQMGADEDTREVIGSEESLVYDWFNPNSGQRASGWQGPFYVPVGAYLHFLPDGFTITRDGRAPQGQRTWRMPDGTDSGESTIRYRIGHVTVDGRPQKYILNSLTYPNIHAANIAQQDFVQQGQPFGGVLYFEGNVRVRGSLPTDVQLTVVSNATIYVEGSITKGIVKSTSHDGYDGGNASNTNDWRINRPSRSMLMLMASDYVAVNTTQFFGTAMGAALQEVEELPTAIAWNPIRMNASGGLLRFRSEMLLAPNGINPTTWRPFAADYIQAGTNTPVNTHLLLTHSRDEGAGRYSFITLHVNYGLTTTSHYLFELTPTNAASAYYSEGQSHAPVYGLGEESWQQYTKFESIAFPFVTPTGAALGGYYWAMNAPHGNYTFTLQDTNDIAISPNILGAAGANDYLIARAALIPHDVRIEASLYAENGSVVVIPGNWFNPNPNDRRDTYDFNDQLAAQRRLENFGSYPAMPFFGEPLDVRVVVLGAISENMPLPMSQQAEWLRKWGWIPRTIGSSGTRIPSSHVPAGYDVNVNPYVPNLIVSYDPSLATARVGGFDNVPTNPLIRTDDYGRALPPMPRLPVSPTLAYFGEVN